MIRLGIRAHDVSSASTPRELGKRVRELGLSAVQLAPAKSFPDLVAGPAALNLGLARWLGAELEAEGVEVAVMGSYFNMIDPEPDKRAQGIDTFIHNLSLASALGAHVVASETGSVDPAFHYTTQNFTDEAFDQTIETITTLCSAAEKFGVMVGIEAGVNHPIHDIATIERMFACVDSPNLGLVLDPTALITPDIAELQVDMCRDILRRFSGRVCACHLVDFRIEAGELVRCAIGCGQAPVRELVAAFEEALPGGYVLMEFTPEADVEQALTALSD